MNKLFKLFEEAYPNEMVTITINVLNSKSQIRLKLSSSDDTAHYTGSIKELKRLVKEDMVTPTPFYDGNERKKLSLKSC